MTNTNVPHSFELVRKGYAPAQVDQTMSQLVNDLGAMRHELDTERARRAELVEQIEALHAERALMDPTGSGQYRGLGDRIEQIFRLAEEEAKEARDSALAAVEEQHRGAHEQAAATRGSADSYAQERQAAAEAEAVRVVEEARKAADALREEAERDARLRREETEVLIEQNRALAAQEAADFEATIATRRSEAERSFGERLVAIETAIQTSQQRSEAMLAEAESVRTESEAKAQRTLEAAKAEADATIREAQATAARIREQADNDLAALMQRRDSINAQLANVRRMLATLTGGSVESLLEPAEGEQIEYIEVEYAEEGEDVGEIQVEFVDLTDGQAPPAAQPSSFPEAPAASDASAPPAPPAPPASDATTAGNSATDAPPSTESGGSPLGTEPASAGQPTR